MRNKLYAIVGAALLIATVPASAEPASSTDVSAQSVRIEGPGVGVRVGHDRWDSRRRDRRVHDRFESRGRGGTSCRTVTIKERLPGGGVKIVKRRDC